MWVRLDPQHVYVAHAEGTVRGGVLLYPSILGVDGLLRGCAHEFARAGITAVAWDPYNGEEISRDVPEMLARSKRCEDRAVLRELTAIVDHMTVELGLSRIAGIGFCFGGRIALVHAGTDDRICAVSAYNPTVFSDTIPTETPASSGGHAVTRADYPGQTLDEFSLAAAIKGPVQLCHPGLDFTPPALYQQLMDVLRGRPDPTIYEFYPGAVHGFNFTSGEDNERARRYAWATTLSLFSLAFERA